MSDPLDLEKLKTSIRLHEGAVMERGRFMQYKDSEGNDTEGYGHLVANGISKAAAEQILDDDIKDALRELQNYVWWNAALASAETRGRAIAEIYFELGHVRFNGFVNTLGALSRGDWNAAADGFANSKWARQVGNRAVLLVAMIRWSSGASAEIHGSDLS